MILGIFLVWSPDEPKRVVWDIISMLFIFIQMLTIPVVIAFDLEIEGDFKVFSDIMDYYFMFDIILSFNTGYYSKGTLIRKRSKIAINYLKFWFWIDLTSSFPYDTIIEIAQENESSNDLQRNAQLLKFIRFLRFIRIIRLLRALKLKKIFGKLQESLSIAEFITSLLSFLKLCVLILCIAHWLACIWYLVAVWQEEMKDTWLAQYGIDQDRWTIKYISAFYYSITTMITIGYGDIHPNSQFEQLFAIFVMILASGVFGYTMNSIMVLFQNQNEDIQDLITKNNVIIKYMKQKDIPVNIQSRVKNYLEWLVDSEQIARSHEQQLIQNLSANLKNEIVSLINGRIIQEIKFISDNFTQTFITQLAFILREKIHGPEEFVFQADENPHEYQERCLYYVSNGSVSVLAIGGKTKTQLATLKKGDFFGEIGFFGDVQRTASIQTCDFVNLMAVSRRDFQELAQCSKIDMEFCCQLKYDIELKQDLSLLKIRCLCCDEIGHVAKYCPKTHYQINSFEKIRVIKETYQHLNEKYKKNRLKRKKINTLYQFRSRTYFMAYQKIQRELGLQYNQFPLVIPGQQLDYIENRNYLSLLDQSPTYKKRLHLKESFTIEKMKDYEMFLPDYNLQKIAVSQNTRAEENIVRIKQSKKTRIQQIIEQTFQSKGPGNILLAFRRRPILKNDQMNFQHTSARSPDNLYFRSDHRLDMSNNRKRLIAVKAKRQNDEKKRENIFTKFTKEQFLAQQQTNQIETSNETQEDPFQKKKNHQQPSYIQLDEESLNAIEATPQKLPGWIKRKSSIIVQTIITQRTHRSLDIESRKPRFDQLFINHNKYILKNQLFLGMNHNLLIKYRNIMQLRDDDQTQY